MEREIVKILLAKQFQLLVQILPNVHHVVIVLGPTVEHLKQSVVKLEYNPKFVFHLIVEKVIVLVLSVKWFQSLVLTLPNVVHVHIVLGPTVEHHKQPAVKLDYNPKFVYHLTVEEVIVQVLLVKWFQSLVLILPNVHHVHIVLGPIMEHHKPLVVKLEYNPKFVYHLIMEEMIVQNQSLKLFQLLVLTLPNVHRVVIVLGPITAHHKPLVVK